MEDGGFEDGEKFRTIDVFTENNFRRKPNIEFEGWKPTAAGYGGYDNRWKPYSGGSGGYDDRSKRQALQNNNLGFIYYILGAVIVYHTLMISELCSAFCNG